MEASYVCPYCGKEIEKEKILFWCATKGTSTDRIRGNFLRRHGIEINASNKFNRKYFRPRWDKEGNPLNIEREDAHGYPTCLKDKLENGVTADELSGSSDNGFEDDRDFDDSAFGDNLSEEQEQEARKITNRACPHCHCALPSQFGMLDSYHVAMFGGRAAGKTTYLVNLFQQIDNQLSKNNLGSLELADESQAFIGPKISYYEKTGTMLPTAAEDGLLPIVCRYCRGDKEAFIIFYDIAGEGTKNSDYMANHIGIHNCETLMMMIDPNMFVQGALFKTWALDKSKDGISQGPIDKGAYCDETIDGFLNTAGRYCHEFGENIKNVICVLTKMDMLLEVEASYFKTGDIELISDTESKHRDAVSLDTLKRVSKELDNFITHKFGISLPQKIKQALGSDKRVALLGVATTTINVNKTKAGNTFQFDYGDWSAIASKHRIAEPFFVLLLYLGLVNGKKEDGTQVKLADHEQQTEPKAQTSQQSKPVEPKKKGLFARLFGR